MLSRIIDLVFASVPRDVCNRRLLVVSVNWTKHAKCPFIIYSFIFDFYKSGSSVSSLASSHFLWIVRLALRVKSNRPPVLDVFM